MLTRTTSRLLMFLLAVSISLLLMACGGEASPQIQVEEPWVRPAPMAAGNGAVYLILKNEGGAADALVGVRSEISEAAELHETIMENDVMRMRPVAGQRVEIPAHGQVEFKPGGLHIMLIGLREKLQPGATVQLTLQFEQSGERTVEAEVRAVAGMQDMSQ